MGRDRADLTAPRKLFMTEVSYQYDLDMIRVKITTGIQE
jgi:hypothetical protein